MKTEITPVSVCIPTYNGIRFLEQCMESILMQTFADIEVIVVDDCSVDDSYQLAKEYSERDERVRVYRNSTNLGLVQNWNKCIELCRGEWIKFVFQDDFLAPDCLEKMMNVANNASFGQKAIFCKREYFFENNSCLDEFEQRMSNAKFFWDMHPNKIRITPKDTIKIIAKWENRNIFGEPSSYLIHKKVFSQLGFFDKSFHHICDFEYWLRIGVNMQMLMIPETLVYFRVHSQSTTSFNRREKPLQMRYLDKVRLFRKFLYDFNYTPLREEMAPWPCNMFIETKTAILARRARIEVEAAEDVRWKDEFEAFCEELNDISTLAKSNYWILAIRYIASKLSLHLKWFIGSLKEWLKNKSHNYFGFSRCAD